MSEPYAYSYTVNLTDEEADEIVANWGPQIKHRDDYLDSLVKLADAIIAQRARPLQVGDQLIPYAGKVVAIDTTDSSNTRVVFQDADTYIHKADLTPGMRVDLDGGGVAVVP